LIRLILYKCLCPAPPAASFLPSNTQSALGGRSLNLICRPLLCRASFYPPSTLDAILIFAPHSAIYIQPPPAHSKHTIHPLRIIILFCYSLRCPIIWHYIYAVLLPSSTTHASKYTLIQSIHCISITI
jgi:hypothetical protein